MKQGHKVINRLIPHAIALLPGALQVQAVRQILVRRFFSAYGHWPNIESPTSFNEWILRRIIFDRDPRLKIICNKIALRAYITQKVGGKFVVPIIGQWRRAGSIDWGALPKNFVLKPSHSSGQVAVVKGSHCQADLTGNAKRWLSHDYFNRSLEWGYLNLPRRVIAEPLLRGPAGGPPPEVQIQVIRGQTVHIGMITGERGTPARFGDWFYPDGTRHPGRQRQPLRSHPLPSIVQDQIVPLAEAIAKDFDQMRVDFYITDRGVKIGELTPYHSGGRSKFDPPDLDFELGRIWTALARSQS